MEPIELTYHEGPDGLLYPDIKEPESFPIGRYGRKKARFMAEHQRVMNGLLTFRCKREEYLAMINKEAEQMEDRLVEQMQQKDPGPSQSDDWEGYVEHMMAQRRAAEEIVWTTYVMPHKVMASREAIEAIHFEWDEEGPEEETEE